MGGWRGCSGEGGVGAGPQLGRGQGAPMHELECNKMFITHLIFLL